jgi:YfiH family protein
VKDGTLPPDVVAGTRDGLAWLSTVSLRPFLSGISVKTHPDETLFVKGGDHHYYSQFLDLPMFDGLTPVVPYQVHGAQVAIIEEGKTDYRPTADGVATTRRDVVLTISVADCAPVYLVGPTAVALVHAGWRGARAGVVRSAVRVLSDLGSTPISLRVWIGPRAGADSYEVGDDVASLFPSRFYRPSRNGRFHLDLGGCIASELIDAGVPQSSVSASRLCTMSRPDLLHSYRLEGENCGQMLAFLSRKTVDIGDGAGAY